MRDLKKTEKNAVTLIDTLSGSRITIFYATPTTSQLKVYSRESLHRKGNRIRHDSFEPSLKYGLHIITGIGEGCFAYDGKPISSDPASPAFREDWKELLGETAADIVTAVGRMVFEGVRPEQGAADILVGDEEETEELRPLPQS